MRVLTLKTQLGQQRLELVDLEVWTQEPDELQRIEAHRVDCLPLDIREITL